MKSSESVTEASVARSGNGAASPNYNPLSRVPRNDPARAEGWKEACRIAHWLKDQYPDCVVRAFGSIVRPNAWSPRSDIDIAVSGIPGFSWSLVMHVHDEFPKFEVQVVSVDVEPIGKSLIKNREFFRQFTAEILATGIEIPAPLQSISCAPELVILADRLGKACELMTREFTEFFYDATISNPPKSIVVDACLFHADRYRIHLERGLERVVGYIDRLKPKYSERNERLRLYIRAKRDVPGLRPALITLEIARWHAKFVKLEYSLPDDSERLEAFRLHRKELPEIHHKTLESFQKFRTFLIESASASTDSDQEDRVPMTDSRRAV